MWENLVGTIKSNRNRISNTLHIIKNLIGITGYCLLAVIFTFYLFSSEFNLEYKEVLLSIHYSITFLVVAILSTISSKTDDHIYGRRVIDIVFNQKRLINIRVLITWCIMLTILNTVFFFYDSLDQAFVLVLLLTVGSLYYLIMSCVNLAYPSNRLRKNVEEDYYQLVKKSFENDDFDITSSEFQKFVDYTIYCFKTGSMKEAHENLDLAFNLLYRFVISERKKYVKEIQSRQSAYKKNVFRVYNNLLDWLLINGFNDEALFHANQLLSYHCKNEIFIMHKFDNLVENSLKLLSDANSINEYKKKICCLDCIAV